MSTFKNIDDELFCEGVSLSEIAGEVGTPCYIYSRERLESNFRSIKDPLYSSDHLICYAVKANGNLNIIKILAEFGCGADVVSGGELELAIRARIPPHKIVFAGVGKTDREIQKAIHQKILSINVESFEEIKIVDNIARKMGEEAHVAIRINPDVHIESHPHIVTGIKEAKFGIELERAEEAFHLAAQLPGLQVNGIHCHIGSMIMEKAPFLEAAGILADLVKVLKKSGINLRNVDIGGGLGIDYSNIVPGETEGDHEGRKAFKPESLFKSILPLFEDLNVKILFEPGRYLVADTAALVTRVLLTKETKEKKFVIVDAGMNDLIRPSLYDSYHQIVRVTSENNDIETANIVGPICETGDYFALDRQLPRVGRGDLLAVMAAGAYGYALSSNYNGRLRLPEVLVDGESYRLIRNREKLEDLWREVVWD